MEEKLDNIILMNNLELRMYFLVPYNISPIQQAIQAGHCVEEYGDKFRHTELYRLYRTHKTWIILNGGTTNDMIDGDGFYCGTLNQDLARLMMNNVPHATFREPDLNNSLTAICFICDERVWDIKNWPDFAFPDFIDKVQDDIVDAEYKEWIDYMGGLKNLFLRELIRNKRLA